MIKTIKYLTFLSLITLCVIQGLWQVDRGKEKKDIDKSYINKINNRHIDVNLISTKHRKCTNIISKN